MKIETVLERALHQEAGTRIEEENQTPKVEFIERYETRSIGGRHQAGVPIYSA